MRKEESSKVSRMSLHQWGKSSSIGLRLDAGGVRMPGGHEGAAEGAGDASCLIIVSAASRCSRRKTPLS